MRCVWKQPNKWRNSRCFPFHQLFMTTLAPSHHCVAICATWLKAHRCFLTDNTRQILYNHVIAAQSPQQDKNTLSLLLIHWHCDGLSCHTEAEVYLSGSLTHEWRLYCKTIIIMGNNVLWLNYSTLVSPWVHPLLTLTGKILKIGLFQRPQFSTSRRRLPVFPCPDPSSPWLTRGQQNCSWAWWARFITVSSSWGLTANHSQAELTDTVKSRLHISIGLFYTSKLAVKKEICRGNRFLFSLGSWINAESSRSKNKVDLLCYNKTFLQMQHIFETQGCVLNRLSIFESSNGASPYFHFHEDNLPLSHLCF